ncbi:hypothetical protein T265_07055 [Opisthorchis viverrini]|uniref:Uncharacterized protein n=1 Tax=Opisthorchis viverrini TaxID=6198 RepID=A0A074ZDY0_OPIVI|nr:hypothetical protein T265_07055 [Opisthorchis viverrini]KER25486.1 hypothetical protein T265_07055 [Opisthorchis viverrini]
MDGELCQVDSKSLSDMRGKKNTEQAQQANEAANQIGRKKAAPERDHFSDWTPCDWSVEWLARLREKTGNDEDHLWNIQLQQTGTSSTVEPSPALEQDSVLERRTLWHLSSPAFS